MKLKKKQNTGLVVDESSYKRYYPIMSQTVSYSQFIGNAVLESSTHCISSNTILDPKGREIVIYNYVEDDLSKYLYKGEDVFIRRETKELYMCSSIRLSDELYVTSFFGCTSITKLPPKATKDSTNHIITFDIESIPTAELHEELLTALTPCESDVMIISIIKNYLREVVNNGTV